MASSLKESTLESKIDLLQQLITEGKRFTFQNFCFPTRSGNYAGDDTPEWLAWKTRVQNLIYSNFAESSPVQKVLHESLKISTEGNSDETFLKKQSLMLRSLEMAVEVMKNDAFGELRKASSPNPLSSLSNRVFIVHGHDHALKTDVEALLHQLGLEPVVLHRQADKGQTLIEKLEENADVGFAFVLLTPDDIGFSQEQESVPEDERKQELRARQNVVFEFGYFVGRLGRDRVCCLYKRGVTIPSDLAGLVYKQVDGSIESQAYSIIKELKAAGYSLRI
jgi:predicted nucleotide-binding protein